MLGPRTLGQIIKTAKTKRDEPIIKWLKKLVYRHGGMIDLEDEEDAENPNKDRESTINPDGMFEHNEHRYSIVLLEIAFSQIGNGPG